MPDIAINYAAPRIRSRGRWPRSAPEPPRKCSRSICTLRSTLSTNYLEAETKRRSAMPSLASFASGNDANDSRQYMLYERSLRPLLFVLDPETAHAFALAVLPASDPVLPEAADET